MVVQRHDRSWNGGVIGFAVGGVVPFGGGGGGDGGRSSGRPDLPARRATTPAARAGKGSEERGAMPIEYEHKEGYVSMDDAWSALPPIVRNSALEKIGNERWRVRGRWFADNRDGAWRLVIAGERTVVLIARPAGPTSSVVRYTFACDPGLEQQKFTWKAVPPQHDRGPAGTATPSTVDAPPEWGRVFPGLPGRAQSIVEHWFPPSKRAMRWCTGLLATDNSDEELWVVVGNAKRVVYVYAHRAVPPDPFGNVSATDGRRREAPWTVVALRGECAPPDKRPELARAPATR